MRRPCPAALGAIGVSAKRWNTRVDVFDQLCRAKELLESTTDRMVSLKEAAEAAGMSEFHFQRHFTETFGVSPQVLAQKSRLRYAGHLLQTTDLDVGHVAAEVGYSSPSSFSRAFKASFGQSPTAYRLGLKA